jgi:hypothetical protein
VSIIEQTLDRYPEVQALEAAESDAQLEGGEKAESGSAALARGVQGLGLGVKDPLGKGKRPGKVRRRSWSLVGVVKEGRLV